MNAVQVMSRSKPARIEALVQASFLSLLEIQLVCDITQTNLSLFKLLLPITSHRHSINVFTVGIARHNLTYSGLHNHQWILISSQNCGLYVGVKENFSDCIPLATNMNC